MTVPPPADEQPGQLPARFSFNLPPEQEGGCYANVAAVWHDNDGFILDFSVITKPAEPMTDDAGATFAHIAAKVVSRVRIPASQAFELMKALNTQLAQWETERTQKPTEGQS